MYLNLEKVYRILDDDEKLELLSTERQKAEGLKAKQAFAISFADESSYVNIIHYLTTEDRFFEAIDICSLGILIHPHSSYLVELKSKLISNESLHLMLPVKLDQKAAVKTLDTITLHQELIKILPNNTRAYEQLAAVYEDLQMHEEAMQAYDMAVSLDPSNSSALHLKAEILEEIGKHEEAEALHIAASAVAIKIPHTKSLRFSSGRERIKLVAEAAGSRKKTIANGQLDINLHDNFREFLIEKEDLDNFSEAVQLVTESISCETQERSIRELSREEETLLDIEQVCKLAKCCGESGETENVKRVRDILRYLEEERGKILEERSKIITANRMSTRVVDSEYFSRNQTI